MVSIRQGLLAEGVRVSMVKLCRRLGQPRRTAYHRSTKVPPRVRAELAEPIKALIEAEPSLGYRMAQWQGNDGDARNRTAWRNG